MVRSSLKEKDALMVGSHFKFRGTDNTRIEALSDGVFAIAMALLIISSSIPKTFSELILFLQDLIPFAICMIMLIMIWFQHYTFFIRYGFKDVKIVVINTLLLFLILFYIYPLKFFMQLLFELFVGLISQDYEILRQLFTNVIESRDTPTLMVIYGLGAASIFFTLAWMYFIAYQRKDLINLNQVEQFLTKSSMIANLLMGSIPLLSCIVALMINDASMAFSCAGYVYGLYPIVMILFARTNRKKCKVLIFEKQTK